MAKKACHAFACTAQVGLTQALGAGDSSMRHAFVIALLLFLAACSSKLSLALPSGSPVRVVTPSSSAERLLQPADEDYRHLQDWLAQNQSGWSQVYATNPNGGIFVSCGSFRLQFIDSTVFVITSEGMLSKTVEESEYAFLNSRAGT